MPKKNKKPKPVKMPNCIYTHKISDEKLTVTYCTRNLISFINEEGDMDVMPREAFAEIIKEELEV